MIILQIQIKVKQGMENAFMEVTRDNCINSLKEEGIYRFDLYQQKDDPSRFTLVEVYRDVEAQNEHKLTAHYDRWRTKAEPMMAEPRTRVLYTNVFPSNSEWQ